jgi:hypothetical protein
VIKELPNMPKLPIEEGIAELESVISETADKAKGAFKEHNAALNGAVKSVATAVKDAADDATIKASRAGLAPSGNRPNPDKPEKPLLLHLATIQDIVDDPKYRGMDWDEGFLEDGSDRLRGRDLLEQIKYNRNDLVKFRNKLRMNTYESELKKWEQHQALLT